MSASNSTLPNPIVYLNYLPPNVAVDYQLAQAIYVATLGAMIWDILSCICQDWKLLRISKLTPPYVAYHISRWFAFAYVVLFVAARTGSISNCRKAQIASCVCAFFTSIGSDFLFFARVHAAYYSNKLVRWTFLILWIVDVCVMLMIFWGTGVSNIADTAYCIDVGGKPFLATTLFMPLFFDSMVFIFMTVKLMSTRYPTEQFTLRTLLSGQIFPRLSRAIFVGGQQYYLIRICFSIITSTFWLAHSVPAALQPSLTVPGLAITSSMACRVYRNLKLQIFDDEPTGMTPPLTTGIVLTTYMHASMNETIVSKAENLVSDGSAVPVSRYPGIREGAENKV